MRQLLPEIDHRDPGVYLFPLQIAELATEQGPDAQSRASLLQQLESHGPAAAGSWRLALLCSGNLPNETLAMIRCPCNTSLPALVGRWTLDVQRSF